MDKTCLLDSVFYFGSRRAKVFFEICSILFASNQLLGKSAYRLGYGAITSIVFPGRNRYCRVNGYGGPLYPLY